LILTPPPPTILDVLPAVNSTFPESPLPDDPTDIVMEPAYPVATSPVDSEISPLDPPVAWPDQTEMSPLCPTLPALLEQMDNTPLSPVFAYPLAIFTDPPVAILL
jgi:hypothetical protein